MIYVGKGLASINGLGLEPALIDPTMPVGRANADRVGAYFQKKLAAEIATHPLVGEVRGSGLIAGIELSADKKTKRPFAPTVGAARIANNHAFRNGLLSRPLLNSDILGFSPPLIITESEVDELVRRLRRALDGALAELPADVRPR